MKYHLALIKIPVSNITESLKFYEEHLNINNIFFEETYGWAQFDLDGIPFALYQVKLGGGERTLGGSIDFHLALDEREFKVRSKKWLDLGILFENMIHQGNDGSSFVELEDPDHNTLKIMMIKK